MDNSQVNIVEVITQTINNLFSNLFSSIDNSLYSILDDLLFVDSSIFNNTHIKNILGNLNSGGIILICNSLLMGFILYYILTLILSYFTFVRTQSPYQFIFKLFFCSILMNSSAYIMQNLFELFSNISLAIKELGEQIFDKNICLSTFIEEFNSTIYLDNSGLNVFSLEGLIKGFISIGFLNLVLSYGIRYILLELFIILSPFAFISLINNNTSWIFKSWLKLLISLLILQILVSLILLVSFSIDVNMSDSFSKIIYISSIYAIIKANNFIKDFMGGLSTEINLGLSSIKSLFPR